MIMLRAVFEISVMIVWVLTTGIQTHAQSQVGQELAQPGRSIWYKDVIDKNENLVKFIENTLAEKGLPKMLRNLALIESGFNKQAVSSAKAGGIWQFTVGHAGNYGLSAQDRFDVYKSTQVAVKSLKNLYAKYGNWISVVAAYNCGEGNVDKAIQRAASDRYNVYYRYLPNETIHHVRKFMEACQVTGELSLLVADYRIFAFKPNHKEWEMNHNIGDPSLVAVEINAAFDIEVIMEELKIDLEDFYTWNPSIVANLEDNGTAEMYLPVDVMPDFYLKKNIILNRSLKEQEYE